MKIRYFIESALQQGPNGQWYFAPIGVWAHGLGLGMDISMAYLPGYETAQSVAEGIINDLIERGARTLPSGFLEQQRAHLPLYTGDCSPIYTTEARNSEEVAVHVLALILAKRWLEQPKTKVLYSTST